MDVTCIPPSNTIHIIITVRGANHHGNHPFLIKKSHLGWCVLAIVHAIRFEKSLGFSESRRVTIAIAVHIVANHLASVLEASQIRGTIVAG
jgi:hypothetical protein